MKNLANQTFKIEEAVTMVNSVAKTSRLTGDTLFIKEVIFARLEGDKVNDGVFYNGNTKSESFMVFHRFATDNLELDVLPRQSRNKDITITKRILITI